MVLAGMDGYGRFPGAEIDRWQVVAHLTGIVTQGVGVALPELTEVVFPPALENAVSSLGTRMELTHTD